MQVIGWHLQTLAEDTQRNIA